MRPPKDDPIRYEIASHDWLPGVRLSRLGLSGWGNIPYPDEEAAREAIHADARKTAFTVTRKHLKGRGLSGILS